jgi:hypothetical protein
MNSDQHKEHIINVIKELDIKQQNIENKLQELRIFYITNKDKNDYKLAKTFFDNFLELHYKYASDRNNFPASDIPPTSHFFSNDNYKTFLCLYFENIDSSNSIHNTPDQRKDHTQRAKDCFNIICKEEEDKLTHLMLINEKKLKYYENKLTELSPEQNIMELYPEQNIMDKNKKQYSVSASVIFLIMIVFYVMTVTTVVLLVNPNHNYNTAALHHPMQCSQSTRLIDKHKKLRDIMII